MDSSLEKLLLQGAASLGVNLGENEVRLYFQYLKSLLEWNEKFNLTAITEPREVVVKHFLDSLSIFPYLKKDGGKRLLDVGTGAGFPGIPLKITVPEMEVVLMDSLNKRVTFLNRIIKELGLSGITAVHRRAEDAGRRENYRESFDMVVSRAVARLSVLLEICIPFLKVGGTFVAYKGPKVGEELEEAGNALKIMNARVMRREEVALPGLDEQRTLVFIEKRGPTPEKYPRKAGMPEKRPL